MASVRQRTSVSWDSSAGTSLLGLWGGTMLPFVSLSLGQLDVCVSLCKGLAQAPRQHLSAGEPVSGTHSDFGKCDEGRN